MDFDLAFPTLVAGRLLLAFAPLPDALKHDQLLASPLTSYPRLQEGIHLFKNGVDPYSGGLFRQSPLLLSLFSTVSPLSNITSPLLWTASDSIAAWALVRLWRARQRLTKSSRDGLIAAAYLLNPYILLPTLAFSTSSFDNTLHLLALMFACEGRCAAALFTLAFHVHLSLSSSILILPVMLLLITDPISRLASPRAFASDPKRVLPLAIQFSVYFVSLTLLSTLVCGSFSWVEQTWGAIFTLPDLTPNPGLWWYFFTEMFDHFRSFFLMVFTVHLSIYVLPVCIKFQHDLLYATYLLTGVLATFKAYPTLSDPGLFLSMSVLFPETYSHLRHPIVTGLLHLHASLLLPLFNHLWLTTGTGNANFFYASTLVFGMANGGGLIDAIWAGLTTAMKVKEGYEVTQE